MTRRAMYLVLAAIGGAAPWVFFFRFFQAEGLQGAFVPALFANGAAGGFTMDLLITSLVFWIFLFAEGRRVGVARLWMYVAINLAIGLSCALPLFLWAREGVRASATDQKLHGSARAAGSAL